MKDVSAIIKKIIDDAPRDLAKKHLCQWVMHYLDLFDRYECTGEMVYGSKCSRAFITWYEIDNYPDVWYIMDDIPEGYPSKSDILYFKKGDTDFRLIANTRLKFTSNENLIAHFTALWISNSDLIK